MRIKPSIIALIAFTGCALATGDHGHRHKHQRRDDTEIQNVQYRHEDVLVHVNEENKPLSSSSVWKNLVDTSPASNPSPPPTTTAATPLSDSEQSPKQAPVPVPAYEEEDHPAPQPSSLHPRSAPPPPQYLVAPDTPNEYGETGGNGGGGTTSYSSAITYTPYNADNSCKSSSQVHKDLAAATAYSLIRLYGTDCNQVGNVLAAAPNVKLFLGIFDIYNIQSEIDTMASALSKDWSRVTAVSVGNELVNSGKASPGQVTSAIGTARSALKGAGYNGPVVTVDTMTAMRNNIQLCKASDFCAINCHAFFDGHILPAGAGDFVKGWVDQISKLAGGKKTVVTESGWPTKGSANGVAVPSEENQQKALQSLKDKFGSSGEDLVVYGMYNDLWKSDGGGTFGCEKYWGVHGNAPS